VKNKGFNPNKMNPFAAGKAPNPNPNPAGGVNPMQVLKEMSDKIKAYEISLQNTFGYMECKTNTLLRVLKEKGLIESDEAFEKIFQEENKKILAQFEETQDKLQKRAAYDGEIADKDWVTIKYSALIDSKPFPGSVSAGYEFQVGTGHMLPDINNSVKGKKVGDTFKVQVTFPVNYPNSEIAGKIALFDLEITKVKRSIEGVQEPQEGEKGLEDGKTDEGHTTE
jgi:FKBP-type peptidyl-prolyl cis-trans isomerase